VSKLNCVVKKVINCNAVEERKNRLSKLQKISTSTISHSHANAKIS